jgi:putative nucleotidyltransferase with HDIG domain
MSALAELAPGPPDWRLDWPAIDAAFDCIRALKGCPQDAIHHAEGDVWIHTRMVIQSLVATARWRELPTADRLLTFAGALFHDIGKPARTRVEDGRISSRGHSAKGENMVRVLLWRMGVPIDTREQIAALVAHHQVPFGFLDRDDPLRIAAQISLRTRNELLACIAEADARGRICRDPDRIVEQVELFRVYCGEAGCLDAAFRFPSDHSRFEYFRTPGRSPHFAAHDDARSDVVVMSGLPAAGKDAWIRRHLPDWPIISFDAIRDELDIDTADAQGQVIAAAKDRARRYLRGEKPFVWNATNLGRATRRHWIDLFAGYKARIRLVHVEAPEPVLRARNRQRPRPVPDQVIDRMLTRWQVPDSTEAQSVEWIVTDD